MHANRSGRSIALFVLIVVLICGGGAAGFWLGLHARGMAGLPRIHGAVGLIAVDPTPMADPLEGPRPETPIDFRQIEIEQRTEATLLTSESLLKGVLANRDSPIYRTEWIKQFAAGADGKSFDVSPAAKWLADHVVARPIKDSKLVEIFIDGKQADAKTIIESIVDAHLENLRAVATQRLVDRSTSLNMLKYKDENQLKELSDQRNSLITSLGLFSGPGNIQHSTIGDLEIEKLLAKRVELSTLHAEAIATVDTLHARYNSATTQRSASDDAIAARERSMLEDAQLHVATGKAALDAIDQQIEGATAKLNRRVIAMTDYQSVQSQIDDVSLKLRAVKSKLDQIASSSGHSSVDWARHPEMPSDGD